MSKPTLRSIAYSQLLFFVWLPIWIRLTEYLHPLVIVVVWFCLTSFFLFISFWISKKKMFITKPVLDVITLLYFIGLVILLFFRPENQSYGSINLVPFRTVSFYLAGHVDGLIAFYNLGANIGLFVPFGLYYCYIKNKPSLGQALLISVAGISLIESLQFLTKRGSLDIDDVLLNVFGVWMGYLLYPFVSKVFVMKRKKKRNRVTFFSK